MCHLCGSQWATKVFVLFGVQISDLSRIFPFEALITLNLPAGFIESVIRNRVYAVDLQIVIVVHHLSWTCLIIIWIQIFEDLKRQCSPCFSIDCSSECSTILELNASILKYFAFPYGRILTMWPSLFFISAYQPKNGNRRNCLLSFENGHFVSRRPIHIWYSEFTFWSTSSSPIHNLKKRS